MKTALLLIDIQNDYFPGGANELWRSAEAAAKAREALALFRKNAWPVVHVRHINTREGATFFLPDTPGSEINDAVRPAPGEEVVVKHYPDSFLQTTLRQRLEDLGVERIVVCGMMSHMCVDTTVRAAKAYGYDITLLHDACTTMALAWNGETLPADSVHKTFMASLQGAFARVIDTASLQ